MRLRHQHIPASLRARPQQIYRALNVRPFVDPVRLPRLGFVAERPAVSVEPSGALLLRRCQQLGRPEEAEAVEGGQQLCGSGSTVGMSCAARSCPLWRARRDGDGEGVRCGVWGPWVP